MAPTPQNSPDSSSLGSPPPGGSPEIDAEALLIALRRKQGSWVEWGQACQQLQKAGYNPQTLFEETGFEPTHQSQVIVGSQVYNSMVAAGVSEAVQSYFQGRGSDILYEFRILSQDQRAAAAELALSKNLDADSAREVAKALKEFSYRKRLPEGFSDHPGDALAYSYWRLARQHEDLQTRSRLIAEGLKFAHSDTARQQVEKLLTDFTRIKARPAPTLPFYRPTSDDELPRMVPVAGQLPLTVDIFQSLSIPPDANPFRIVQTDPGGAWVPLPGWQVILTATEPIAILAMSDQLPNVESDRVEQILLLIDRAQTNWQDDRYFVVANEANHLQVAWFETEPNMPLLGQLILVVRPKKILDEDFTKELWQVEE